MFSAVMKVRDINKVVSDAQDCEHTCENVSSLKKKNIYITSYEKN